MDRITTTIKKPWLAAIIAGEKKVEYREMKPYWKKRLENVSIPFELRLINGMQPRAPEATVIVGRISRNLKTREYELHIRRVVKHSNWSKRRAANIAAPRGTANPR